MAKKKKGTAQKQPEAEPASPSTIPDPQTPVNIPTPSTANGASTDGTTTPNENGVKAEPTPEDKIKIADELKEKGNVAFKARKYEDAIKLYAEAIGKYTHGVCESLEYSMTQIPRHCTISSCLLCQ
jgi:DnaJ family protein C protein 7